MGNSEFQNILQKLMKNPTDFAPASSPEFQTAKPSAESLSFDLFWTQILSMGQGEASTTASLTKTQLKKFIVHKPKTAAPQPIPRVLHSLNETQQKALDYFHRWGQKLGKDFVDQELSTAFRHLAFMIHPDHGGRAEQFMELHSHYRELKKLLK